MSTIEESMDEPKSISISASSFSSTRNISPLTGSSETHGCSTSVSQSQYTSKSRRRLGRRKCIGRKRKSYTTTRGFSTTAKRRKVRQVYQVLSDSEDEESDYELSTSEFDRETKRQRRMLISMYYTHHLGQPHHSLWHGHPGTISQIARNLNIKTHRSTIHRVLVSTDECLEKGMTYTGDSQSRGRPQYKIKPGSMEQSIVMNFWERGASYTVTTAVVNIHRLRQGLPAIGRSAIVSAEKRMVHRMTPVYRRAQGNTDPLSEWARMNYKQTAQFLVMTGHEEGLDFNDFEDKCIRLEGYAKENLPTVSEFGLTWWDEVHRDCSISELGADKRSSVQFPRDSEGKYNEQGTYAKPPMTCKHKYTDQMRKSFGVGKVKDVLTGEVRGVRLAPFDYSAKLLVTEEKMDEMRVLAIRILKRKTRRDHPQWTVSNRPDGVLYSSEPLTVVKGVGAKSVRHWQRYPLLMSKLFMIWMSIMVPCTLQLLQRQG